MSARLIRASSPNPASPCTKVWSRTYQIETAKENPNERRSENNEDRWETICARRTGDFSTEQRKGGGEEEWKAAGVSRTG